MNLFIYGAGDLGREIYYTILEINKTSSKAIVPTAFVEDAKYSDKDSLDGLTVRTYESMTKEELVDSYFIIAIGNSSVRKTIRKKIEAVGAKLFDTVIHPKAYIAANVNIDKGCFIGPNTTVSIGSEINKNVIINQNCSIGHDCVLQEDVVISPGCVLSGRTNIGKATFLGSSAVTLPLINIGENCIVGANVTISQSINDSLKVLAVVRNMSLPVEE